MDSDSYNEAVDCDEDDPMTHPGAVEVCNDNDDDCDGLIDEDFDQDQDLYTTIAGLQRHSAPGDLRQPAHHRLFHQPRWNGVL